MTRLHELKVRLQRKWQLRNLNNWERGLLARYIDENRFVRGTEIRDTDITKAAMAGELGQFVHLTTNQLEACVVSVKGHLKPGKVSLRSDF